MPKRVIDLRDERPLLDVATYARGGRLTSVQRLQIALTIRRVPEVMVKVSGGARTLAGVERHMKYIGRKGELELETDVGTRVGGERFERSLVEDWNLDIEALDRQRQPTLRARKPPKLVHNIIFSMPPGTPPQKVVQAVRKFALNEWQLRHRYAMTLHTDTPHPQVHVVVKAVSEQGVRLNIKKAMLRSWRSQFAANLRELGVAATATERAVRGETRDHKSDGYFRSHQRGQSSRLELLKEEIASEIRAGSFRSDAGEEKIRRTRAEVIEGWRALASSLRAKGDHELADGIRIFSGGMRPPLTAKARMAEQLLRSSHWRKGLTRTQDLHRAI